MTTVIITYLNHYLIFMVVITIGLSGKFVPILKENWNAEDLNFSIHLLLNLNLLRHGQPNIIIVILFDCQLYMLIDKIIY